MSTDMQNKEKRQIKLYSNTSQVMNDAIDRIVVEIHNKKRKQDTTNRRHDRIFRKKTLLPLTLALIFSLGSLVLAGQKEKEQKFYYESV